MTGSSPPQAAQSDIDSFQLALSCETDVVATIRGGYYPSEYPHILILMLGEGLPVPLRSDPALSLEVIQNYRIIENSKATARHDQWRVTTISYAYRVLLDKKDELFAYHWHPNHPSSVVTPHLHIGSGSGVTFPGLVKAHLPGGRVSIEEILRTLITEIVVEPNRDDWDRILTQTEAQYRALRTW